MSSKPSALAIANKQDHMLTQKEIEGETEQIVLTADEYDIILVVDQKLRSPALLQELTRLEINYEFYAVPVGQFMWIARDQKCGRNLLLPYIVLKKKLSRFGSEVRDGSLHRLKIELERLKRKVVLLIEKDYPGQKPQTHSCGIPMNNIDTALRNCEVKNGYLVERTDGEKQSIIFLSVYMQKIIGLFKGKELVCISCPLGNLNHFDGDRVYESDLVQCLTLTAFLNYREALEPKVLFMQQLQLIKNVTAEKAAAIAHKYPILECMRQAFAAHSKPEAMLSEIPYGDKSSYLVFVCGCPRYQEKKIGATLSANLYEIYGSKQ